MKSSDFLFRLIKSLSKGDRRNLKLYGKLQEGDKKYLLLFDAIDAQADYDEAAIMAQFEGERFLNQFSVAKNYLYNFILKTLHIFHRDQHAELSIMVHQAEILMSKNLYDQAYKLVRKGKHIAERQERFQELITLLDYERKILNYTERSSEYAVFIDEIKAEELRAAALQANLLEYQHVLDEVYVLTHTKGKQADSKVRIREILTSPHFEQESLAHSQKARIKRLGIMVDCFVFLNDIPNAYAKTLEVIDLYKRNEEIRKEWNTKYLLALANAGVLSYRMGMPQKAMEALDELRNAKVFSHEESVRVFERYYYFKIALCIETGDVERGLEAISDYEQESKALEGHLKKSEELGVYYVAAYFLLAAGHTAAALQWINRLLNEPKTELRMDLQCMARIMGIVIHYELGNHDLIEYMAKAAVRFINNRGHLQQVERVSLRYLRRLSNMGPEQTEEEILTAFEAELQMAASDPAEKKVLNLFDVLAWISARKQRIRIVDVFKNEGKKQEKVAQ